MNLEKKMDYIASGKPYNDLDEVLVQERDRSTLLTNKLNSEVDPIKKEKY